jgi:hypothetical protein
MEAILKRGDAATLPQPARDPAGPAFGVGSAIAARWRRIVARLAERPPGPSRDLPPEWYRYPLP